MKTDKISEEAKSVCDTVNFMTAQTSIDDILSDLAPAQDQYLTSEAFRIAKEAAGRVEPTTEVGGIPMNDNVGLEQEAEIMGARADQF